MEILYDQGRSIIDGKKKYILTTNLQLFLLMISWLGVGITITMLINNFDFKQFETSKPINSNCSNLTLKDTAYCLRDQIEPFYNYTLLNQGRILSFEELKTLGGSCQHYSKYYYDNIPTRYFRQEVSINIGNKTGHKFTIISGEDKINNKTIKSYCILDQTEVKCQELE